MSEATTQKSSPAMASEELCKKIIESERTHWRVPSIIGIRLKAMLNGSLGHEVS